jgi:proton glutamate symport protein
MKKISLTSWIMIALVAGFVFGLAAPSIAVNLGVLGNIFLRLIKSLIAPLMFGTLVASIARAGTVSQMGRIGAKAIVYFTALVTVALALGIGSALVFQPGAGVELGNSAEGVPQAEMNVSELLESPFPESLVDAMARGDVLQIVVFSLIFGFACAAMGERAEPVVRFCEALSEVMFRYTDYVMLLAPIGIFGAMAACMWAWQYSSLAYWVRSLIGHESLRNASLNWSGSRL